MKRVYSIRLAFKIRGLLSYWCTYSINSGATFYHWHFLEKVSLNFSSPVYQWWHLNKQRNIFSVIVKWWKHPAACLHTSGTLITRCFRNEDIRGSSQHISCFNLDGRTQGSRIWCSTFVWQFYPKDRGGFSSPCHLSSEVSPIPAQGTRALTDNVLGATGLPTDGQPWGKQIK